jgi:hypothetical protein
MSHIIHSKTSCYEKESHQTVWRDALMEEYDVWDMFLKLEGKYVVTSKWIYNIKHISYGSIKKHKEIFVAI